MNIMKLFSYLSLLLLVTTLISCSNDDDSPFAGTDNFITSFTLNKDGNEYKAYINENEIVVYAPLSVSLEGAKVTFKISEQATIFPDPSGIADWDNERQFKVTSYDKTEKTYTYKIAYSSQSTQKDIVLSTQQDVDNFKSTNIVQIMGTLTIGSNAKDMAAIENLNGLSNLKEVGYDINLVNYSGEDLNGMKNLEIAGGINIDNATNLKTIDLPKLSKSPIKGLNITAEKLESVNLPKLTESGNFYIRSLNIATLNIPLLETLHGDLTLSANSDPSDDNSINLTGTIENIQISALKKVEGNLYISGFAKVTTIDFPLLETVKSIKIKNIKTSKTFSMPKVKATNEIYLSNFYATEKLEFTSLETINGDFTTYSCKFTDCSGLPALRAINGKLYLWGVNFSNLEGIDNLTIKQGIDIDRNATYTTLDLSKITVPEDADITLTSNCSNIDNLILPESVEATINLSIGFRAAFPTIKGLKSAQYIVFNLPKYNGTVNVIFEDMEKVYNLSVTGKAKTIQCPKLTEAHILSITNCDELSSLDFNKLEKLTNTRSKITIQDCVKLTDFSTFATMFTSYTSMASKNWVVSNCGYTPTFENMKNGQYTEQ